MKHMERLAILSGCRTPQAKAFGELASLSAVDLGISVLQGTLQRANLEADAIDEVIFGNVSGPAEASNVARVISLQAGVPVTKHAFTVNRNCASGMESIISAWHAISVGRASKIIAGGVESMSQVPLLVAESTKHKLMSLARARSWLQKVKAAGQFRWHDFRPVAALELGLTDPTCKLNMGQTAELLAHEFGISRESQDRFALASHQKASAAIERCFMSGEVIGIEVAGEIAKRDQSPRKNQTLEQLSKLRPLFDRTEGTVTAGNSCPLTDGAAALLVTSESIASRESISPLGFVSDYAIAGCDPRHMGLGPVFAIDKLLDQTGLVVGDIDLFEINEAFAAQVLACLQAFESTGFAREQLQRAHAIGTIEPAKLNIHGGAIALGHPVGSTGTRIVLTLLRALREKGLHRGIASLCVGGGQGVAMLVESY
ncbi:MAG: thiolase family protein [Planctomycetales bacterium]|nr:thiolase family protein [Planctomycetales bacterium]